ncbi:MAG TPA: ABC transporter permease [Candidatus Acidoferrum sp.]|jgi:putative ABC transport system permease protein|nr:ABC transporter permease [Candidatus Acidoferrum sp.]
MKWLVEWARRFRMLLHRRQFDADLDEEMRLHLELRQQEQIAAGMPADEARAAARRRFGNATCLKEESHIAWGWEWLENLGQDARYGLRMLRKSPGFGAVAILTMALSIGATTAIFSVVDATLLRPLPYPEPEQLVSIQDDLPGVSARDVGMSEPEWQDLRRSGIFEYVSPTWFDENNLTGSSKPARVRILIVAPNYFALLRVKPQLGHTFDPEDHSPGILPEVVISDGLWKSSFGADPHILDRSIRMDTDLYRIAGVMLPGFDAPGRIAEERNIEIWPATSFYGMPMSDHPPRSRRNLPTAIARLKPGLTIAQAQSRLDALVASLQKEFPRDYPPQSGWAMRLVPLQERVVGNVRQSLILLLCAVALVLLIGCVNIANLLLARASARGREMALRQALGAARKRLVLQLLTESLLLSLTGGVIGLAILFFAKDFLLRFLPENLPRLNHISITWSVLLFAVAASIATGVIFGLAPALHAGRADLTDALKEAGRASTGSGEQTRTRRLLVVTEFALSLVLMIAAGLLLRSFWDLLRVPLGFNPENVMAVRTRLPAPNDPKIDLYGTAEKEAPFLREVLRRARTLPGVEEAAIGDTAAIPLDQSLQDLKRISEGQYLVTFEGSDAQSNQPSVVERSFVTADYFHLMGIPLLRGRLFNDSDNDKSPQVAVINEAFARTYWPNQDSLGKRFKRNREGSPWITVIGITANARTASLAQCGVPQAYLDIYQTNEKRLAIFLRGHLDTAAIPEEVRTQVQSVDPTLPLSGAQTLSETVSASLAERRFSMEMVGLFAVTALLLAGLGIYGVISYIVSASTHEIGIRLALGAQRRNILNEVLRQGLQLAVTGAAAGIAGALLVSHLMAGLLYGVWPADPLTFAGVTALFIGVALGACYIPARRATQIDPIVALRHE